MKLTRTRNYHLRVALRLPADRRSSSSSSFSSCSARTSFCSPGSRFPLPFSRFTLGPQLTSKSSASRAVPRRSIFGIKKLRWNSSVRFCRRRRKKGDLSSFGGPIDALRASRGRDERRAGTRYHLGRARNQFDKVTHDLLFAWEPRGRGISPSPVSLLCPPPLMPSVFICFRLSTRLRSRCFRPRRV